MAGHAAPSAAPQEPWDRSALARFLAKLDAGQADLWAERLLAEFGTTGGVMASTAEAQARVTGSAEAASWLQLARELTRHWLRERAAASPILRVTPDLIAYLRCEHAYAPNECLRALFMTARNMLLRDEVVREGTIDQAPFWPRIILRRCLELNAAAVIIVHNHPSGDHAPSRADIEMTVRFVATARELGIELHDHLIVSSTGHVSMRKLGLI